MNVQKILDLIESYSLTNQTEKKLCGEVLTPVDLINEMLDTLPNEVFEDPTQTFLDSSTGYGQFIAVVVQRLMTGLSTIFPNEKLRYKHIIENMIYVVEIQKKNIDIYFEIFDPDTEYNLNYYFGSFLDDVPLLDRKFSIILGNPPYNNTIDKLNRGVSTTNLPQDFILKSYKLLQPEGYLLYVLPTNNIVKIFFDKKIVALSTNSFEHFGSNALAVKTLYFLQQNIDNKEDTQTVKFIFNDVVKDITIRRGENFEKDASYLSNSIKQKLFYNSVEKFPFTKERAFKSIGNQLHDTIDLDGIKLKITNTDINVSYVGKKFILNFDSRLRYYCDYVGDIKTTLDFIKISTDTEMKNYEFLINSKLIKKISINWGPKGFDVGRFFKLVSKVEIPTNFLINDVYIYEKYNLNKNEIEFITA